VQYFTTHADLVKRQAAAREQAKAQHDKKMIRDDAQWTGEDFVDQTDALARG
jgi:dihydropyrimidine dehydrogenase (NADP+)/dihydropyrimidine dehydrogenase (NAD+) subunit PreA